MKKEINWEKLRAGYEEVQMVQSSIENAYPEAYRLARKFHELYEEQAPFFGYITNPNSREFYPNSNNARLMAYVCYTIVQEEVLASNARIRLQTLQEVQQSLPEEINYLNTEYYEPASIRARGFNSALSALQ